MGAYLINRICARDGIESREALRQVKRTVELHGGRYFDDGDQCIERGRPCSLVLVEFADFVAARSWYTSPDYVQVAHVYVENAIDVALVDGISPDFTMAGFAPSAPLSPTFVKGGTVTGVDR